MKLHKTLIIALIALFSCHEQYLEEELFSDLGGNTFPTNEAQLVNIINGAYNRFTFAFTEHTRYAWATMLPTPQIMYKARDLDVERGAYDIYKWGIGNYVIFDIWNRGWPIIRSCNDALDAIEASDFLTDERRDELMGEAKFIRATTYFSLVRLFGGMPIVRKAQTLSDDIYPPRASLADSYEFIIEDLLDAKAKLPTRSENLSNGRIGHPGKYAAGATLAKVYLTMAGQPLDNSDYLDEARTELEEVISSGEYRLLSDYSQVFRWDDDNNDEILFAVQFAGPQQGISYFFNMFLPPSCPEYSFVPTQSWMGHLAVEPEFADWYRARDSSDRFNHNIRTDWVDTDGNSHNYLDGQNFAAYAGKYRCEDNSSMNSVTRWENNFPWMRYSEILLMHSEVVNELDGPTTEAYSGINEVRDRANMPPIPAGLSKDDFRDWVFDERELELCFEMHALFDLRRRGFDYTKEVMESYYNPDLDYQPEGFSISVDEFQMLYPIPQSELEANKNFQQNPGY